MSLQGTFKTLGITEVLEFLSSRTASGRLDVTTEMGTASYILSDGAVAASEFSFIRESGVDAAEATYYVVSELDGSFFFDDDITDHDGVPATDSEPEDVGSVLFRTADIAERWADVEEVIPSPNHLLTRNTELDGSVTIQPEWWKALEVIGEGSTSLQLASTLQLSALDASLTALAMTNAGLLLVTEIDPLNIALSTELEGPAVENTVPETPTLGAEPEPVNEAPVAAPESVLFEAVEALDALAHEPAEAPVEPMPAAAIETPQEPFFDSSQPVFDASEPVFDASQPVFDASEPVFDASQPVFDASEPVFDASQPVFDASEPVFDASQPLFGEVAESPVFEPVDMLEMVDVEPPAPAAIVDSPAVPAEPTMSFSTPSGMDDHSALEYMVEPEGSAPVAPAHDDDGWSNLHTPDLRPMAATPVTPPPVQEVAPPQQPAPAHDPSPFDGLSVPQQASPFGQSAPVPDVPTAMDVSSLATPPPVGADHQPAAPVPDVPGYPQPMPVSESMATSMAGEVLDDLASMTDELNEPVEGAENWQLDGSFVPESNPPAPAVDGDPFGDLGDLLADDNERSSVLKFLRRD